MARPQSRNKAKAIPDVARIDAVKKDLQHGLSRADIMAKYVEKWQKPSSRTFDRYIAAAKELIEKEAQADEAILKEAKKAELEAMKDEILCDIECDLILSKIARGQLVSKKIVWDGKHEKYVQIDDYPSHSDRVKAITELYKRKGSYAPLRSKVQSTVSFGEGVDEYIIGDDSYSQENTGNTKDQS